MPRLAKGTPLSVRMAHGRPYSRNVASNTDRTVSERVSVSSWHRRRHGVCASLIVSGSHGVASPVRNQPLKSMPPARTSCPKNETGPPKRTRLIPSAPGRR